MLGKWKFVRKQEIECYKGLLGTADLQRGFAEDDSRDRMETIRAQIAMIQQLQEDIRITGITDKEAQILVEVRAYLVVVREFMDRIEESTATDSARDEADRRLDVARSKFFEDRDALERTIQEAV